MTNATWQPTACILCECNCGIEVQLGGDDGRQLLRFKGDRKHPISQGYACEKPHRLDFYQNGRDRLTSPLRRRSDGSFEAIDWDTAIREISQRLAAVRDEHGGDKIFYYGGGGQGNHLPGAYSAATRRVLGSRYRSSALAQEKTGEFWVSGRMIGGATRADFEHCDVGLFIGKNPWHSHGIARARVVLKEIAADPDRTLIVIDPRRTKTAAMADIHLAVKPGTDAWLMAAIDAILVEEDLLDQRFLDGLANGLETVVEALRAVPIADYCARAGLDEAVVRDVARRLGRAKALSSFEDLGVQMNRHSTLVSYLHRLLICLTGSLGKPGTHYMPRPLVDITRGSTGRRSPVANALIVSGLIPCNVVAEECLADHPNRYRAMIIEAANPVHSLADSAKTREALRALETVVVIDVAMSETAREADYVLPASTQFEKAEATFFNFEFPDNAFHLRPAILEPPEGALSEAEIHARLVEALGGYTEEDLAPLHEAAAKGRLAYAGVFMQRVIGNPRLAPLAPVILYRTLGPTLPKGLREGAVIWGLAARFASQHGPSMARAGFTGPLPVAANALFDAVLDSPSGVVYSRDTWEDVLERVKAPNGRIELALDDLLEELASLRAASALTDAEFPFVLSAGERRSFTANTIIRNPAWRKKDASGALRISPADAADFSVSTGDSLRLSTLRGSAVVSVEVSESMQTGHISLPNGMGTGSDDDGRGGISPNELTAAEDRDRFVGTPWHKSVPARLETLQAN